MCSIRLLFCCVKQKTAYEMRIMDCSSDVCSADLNGGLPADYAALTQEQVAAYLAGLGGSGGFGSHADFNGFFAHDYAFIVGGGDPARFTGLPVYSDYVTALNAYYAFLAAGGLPGDYTVLTQEQVAAYLAALDNAGGFASFGALNAFFGQYYAFIAAGGDPAKFAGLPAYADYLAALQTYYAFLLGGGLPSEYSALTQEQVETYLALLDEAGVLQSELSGETLAFLTDYLAYLETGGKPDQFAGLPGNGTDPGTPTNPAYAGGFPNAASGARAFAVNAGVSYQASGSPTLDANGVLTDAGDLGINDARAVDVAGTRRWSSAAMSTAHRASAISTRRRPEPAAASHGSSPRRWHTRCRRPARSIMKCWPRHNPSSRREMAARACSTSTST